MNPNNPDDLLKNKRKRRESIILSSDQVENIDAMINDLRKKKLSHKGPIRALLKEMELFKKGKNK